MEEKGNRHDHSSWPVRLSSFFLDLKVESVKVR